MRSACSGCARPLSVCLCDVLPSPPLRTHTQLVVLQHPHETKHKLATVPILARCLQQCHVIVGRRLHSSSSLIIRSLTNDTPAQLRGDATPKFLLLFPGPDAVQLETWYSSLQSREGGQDLKRIGHEEVASLCSMQLPLERVTVVSNGNKCEARNIPITSHDCEGCQVEADLGGHLTPNNLHTHVIDRESVSKSDITLLVIDGTWEHATEMVKASLPFLQNFVVQVTLPFDVEVEGDGMGDSASIMRKEPFGGCVSTMEAVARALAILEPDGHVIKDKLMMVLRKMVTLQASHFGPPKIRLKLKKKSQRMEAIANLMVDEG